MTVFCTHTMLRVCQSFLSRFLHMQSGLHYFWPCLSLAWLNMPSSGGSCGCNGALNGAAVPKFFDQLLKNNVIMF